MFERLLKSKINKPINDSFTVQLVTPGNKFGKIVIDLIKVEATAEILNFIKQYVFNGEEKCNWFQ